MKLRGNNLVEISSKLLAIMALILVGVVLCRLGEFRSQCLNSKIFDRLVVLSTGVQVRNCSRWMEGLLISDRSASSLALQRRWIEEISSIQEVTLLPKLKSSIYLVTERPFLSHSQLNQLFISKDLAEEKRVFQIELVFELLSSIGAEANELEKHILSEFYVSLVNTDFVQLTFDGSRSRTRENVDWWSAGLSSIEYCASPWRTLSELANCETESGENWRPLLARGLYEVYSESDFEARQKLLSWIQTEVLLGKDSLLLNRPSNVGGEIWIAAEIQRWKKIAGSNGNAGLVLSKLNLVDPLSRLVGIKGLKANEVNWPNLSSPVYFVDEGEVIIEGEYRQIGSKIRPGTLLLFTCAMPLARDIRTAAIESVLLINNCGALPKINFKGVASGQIEDFLSENPDLGVIWIRAKELNRAVNRSPAFARSRLNLRGLRNYSYWREDIWDKYQKAFIPRAAREIVRSHRASREML